MINRYALPFVALSALAACGGGGTGGNQVDPPPAAPTVIKSYTDGSGVLKGTVSQGGVTENFVLATTNPDGALAAIRGATDLAVVDSFSEDEFYYVERAGTTSGGKSVQIIALGENLNVSGSEYTAVGLVSLDDDVGVFTSGSPVSSLPTGTATYTGEASVFTPNLGGGDGTFTMNVNFSDQTGSLAATIPVDGPDSGYFFGSDNLVLNNDGSFTASDATIGLAETDGNSAGISGNFAGSSATGVNGVVYENGSDWEYVGAFYGSR